MTLPRRNPVAFARSPSHERRRHPSLDIEITKDLAAQWGWFLAFGVALVVLGAAAVRGR